jgi:hypothetical protein
MNRSYLFAAALCMAGTTASAQIVYRCGSEYTRTPCADGKRVDVSDPVTPEQRLAALDAAWREQRLGESMARERRAEAAAFHPAMAIGLSAPPPAKAEPVKKAKPKARKRSVETSVDGDFIARVPKTKAAAS